MHQAMERKSRLYVSTSWEPLELRELAEAAHHAPLKRRRSSLACLTPLTVRARGVQGRAQKLTQARQVPLFHHAQHFQHPYALLRLHTAHTVCSLQRIADINGGWWWLSVCHKERQKEAQRNSHNVQVAI